jgi:hypothetical protein
LASYSHHLGGISIDGFAIFPRNPCKDLKVRATKHLPGVIERTGGVFGPLGSFAHSGGPGLLRGIAMSRILGVVSLSIVAVALGIGIVGCSNSSPSNDKMQDSKMKDDKMKGDGKMKDDKMKGDDKMKDDKMKGDGKMKDDKMKDDDKMKSEKK